MRLLENSKILNISFSLLTLHSKKDFLMYCNRVTNYMRKKTQADQIQLNRTKGSDFLTAFVHFDFHSSLSCANSSHRRTGETEYHGARDLRTLQEPGS